MAATAKKTDPKLWERVKAHVTRGTKGGEAGEWSARKAQLAVAEYKKAGGSYEGGKSKDNHLSQWTKEEWGTKSGQESGETHERYLPRKAREALSDEEHARTTAAKRKDTAKGRQFSAQPEDVARKTAKARAPAKPAARKAPAKAAAPGKAPARKPAAKTAAPAAKRAVPAGKAAPKRPSARKAASGTAAAAQKPSARKPEARKPAAKASAARKPAAKTSAARTSAAKAPAARKPAAKAAARKAPARRAATTKGKDV